MTCQATGTEIATSPDSRSRCCVIASTRNTGNHVFRQVVLDGISRYIATPNSERALENLSPFVLGDILADRIAIIEGGDRRTDHAQAARNKERHQRKRTTADRGNLAIIESNDLVFHDYILSDSALAKSWPTMYPEEKAYTANAATIMTYKATITVMMLLIGMIIISLLLVDIVSGMHASHPRTTDDQ